jgi:hypothetical protein
MTNAMQPYERAMALAALSGLKIALGPAFLTAARQRSDSGAWVAAALGEMVLDKVGVFPARFRLPLLVPHTLAGAWVARESLREDGIDDPWATAMGAVVAAGVSTIAPVARIALHKTLGIPDWMLGLAEDYLALQVGTQAMDLPMGSVTEIARGAMEEVAERARPALQTVGIGS